MKDINRRDFLMRSLLASGGILMGSLIDQEGLLGKAAFKSHSTPAILGGEKAHPDSWPIWPNWRGGDWDKRILEVIQSGIWSRSKVTAQFEKQWAEQLGAKRCLTTVNGTNALIVALNQAGVGIGDEVIVPPYTFVATVQAILINGAIPVFADVDRTTFQINPDNIRKKINSRTKAILPVHILGIPVDMDSILEIAHEHNLIVIEDSCQAHLAEWKGQKVGTLGDAGCFSFQNSKNLPIGEGGAIVSDNETFMDRCYSYHNLGLPYGSQAGSLAGAFMVGTKVRFSEYQAAIGLLQMENAIQESNMRWENGQYLTKQLSGIKGIETIRLYPGVTKAVFHLYPIRYISEQLAGMPRALFIKAMIAEGIPCSSGYTPLQTQPFIKSALESRLYQKVYDQDTLNYDAYMEANKCPESDILCNREAVWFAQNMLLTDHNAMDDIADAIYKISTNADKIMRKYRAGEIKQ